MKGGWETFILLMKIITFEGYVEEVERFFVSDFDDRDLRKIREYVVLRLPVETGTTPGELCLLKKKDIQEHKIDGINFVTIYISAGSKKIRFGGKLRKVGRKKKYVGAVFKPRHRTVVLNSDLSRIVKRFVKIHDSKYIIPKCTSNYNVVDEPMGVRGIQKLHKKATDKWNMHEAIHGKIGARHLFKHFVKYTCLKNRFFDPDEMRKLMGHVPTSAHAMYDPILNLEIAFEMVELTFGPVFAKNRPKMQKNIDAYIKLQ